MKNCPLNKRKVAHSIITEEETTEEISKDAINEEKPMDYGEIALASSIKHKLSNGLYIDSAASKHMTFDEGILFDYITYKKPLPIHIGDNNVIYAHGEGKSKITCCDGPATTVITLQKVLHVPKLAKNIADIVI